MRVAHFLGGGNFGGGTVVVLALVKEQIRRGDKVWVYLNCGESTQMFEDIGATTVPIPGWTGPIGPKDILVFLAFWWLCLTRRIELAVTHTSKGGFLGRIAARLAGCRAVVHFIHGFGFHAFTPAKTRKFYIALERFAARFADLQISVGEQHRTIAIEEGICAPDKIVTVLNGVDFTTFDSINRTEARERFGFAPDDLILGSAGRLAEQKGYCYMIDAMPAILAQHPTARFVLVGTGELEQELKAQVASKGLEKNVTFLGFRTDAREFMVACDVFVHPSLWEGLSISLMEAMVSGAPIAASRIAGNVEMIRHEENGLLMEAKNPTDIATQVCRLLNDRPWADSLAAAANRDSRARFSMERMVDENLVLFDRVSGRPTTKRVAATQHA